MKRVSSIHIKGSKGIQLRVKLEVESVSAVLTKNELESVLPELEDQITRILLSKTVPFLRIGIRDIEVR